jgi:hypothetical protein
MAVFQVPRDFGSISQAAAEVNPGDTILVCPGVYHEVVIIPHDKPGIRIMAGNGAVVLDGLSRLAIAFLIQANNTEISGFTIQNFSMGGIRASAPPGAIFLSGTKLINNRVIHMTEGAGVELLGTFASLIWKNQILGSGGNGINIQARDTWLVENEIYASRGNGIATLTNTTVGNMMIGNRLLTNGKNGIADSAGLNLFEGNFIAGNRINGIHQLSGKGSAGLIRNDIRNNGGHGVLLNTMGHMVTGNSIMGNHLSGVRIEGDFNSVEENRITGNQGNGIIIGSSAQGNLVIRNHFNQNVPVDIDRVNSRNDVVENCCATSNPPGLCSATSPGSGQLAGAGVTGNIANNAGASAEMFHWMDLQQQLIGVLELNPDGMKPDQSESNCPVLRILKADLERVAGDNGLFSTGI